MAMMISQTQLSSKRLQKQLFMVFPPFVKLQGRAMPVIPPLCYHHMRGATKGDGFCGFGAKKGEGRALICLDFCLDLW